MKTMKSSTAWKNVLLARSKGPSNIKPANTLVFTWGNPSRGDDALGPQLYETLISEAFADVDVLTDFQLQIEHILDLENRQRVLFVDASISSRKPFDFYQLQAEQDDSYTTHAMSPQSLLAVYEKVNKRAAPPSFMLSIRGYQFDLGSSLSAEAVVNLGEATGFIRQRLDINSTKDWTENQHVSDR